MYKNLIETAHQEGFAEVVIGALVCKEDGEILLIEDLIGNDRFYYFPDADMKEGESIPQALQRAVTEKTAMSLKEVKGFLGHFDRDKKRHLNFIVEVLDPYAVEENKSISYAWLDPRDAVGYPIHDEERAILNLYIKEC